MITRIPLQFVVSFKFIYLFYFYLFYFFEKANIWTSAELFRCTFIKRRKIDTWLGQLCRPFYGNIVETSELACKAL